MPTRETKQHTEVCTHWQKGLERMDTILTKEIELAHDRDRPTWRSRSYVWCLPTIQGNVISAIRIRQNDNTPNDSNSVPFEPWQFISHFRPATVPSIHGKISKASTRFAAQCVIFRTNLSLFLSLPVCLPLYIYIAQFAVTHIGLRQMRIASRAYTPSSCHQLRDLCNF